MVLRSVTPATAGFFRCEASGEGPAFRSVSGGAALSVVILPKKKPEIFGGYVVNEEDGAMELNCTTDASRPAAQIRWLINNVPVNPELIQESSVSRASSGLETSFSVLELQSKDHFPRFGKGTVKGAGTNTATVTSEAANLIRLKIYQHRPCLPSLIGQHCHLRPLIRVTAEFIRRNRDSITNYRGGSHSSVNNTVNEFFVVVTLPVPKLFNR